jgi:hypothetical protein
MAAISPSGEALSATFSVADVTVELSAARRYCWRAPAQ